MTTDFLTIHLPMAKWIAVYDCIQPFGQVSEHLNALRKLDTVTAVGRFDGGFCPEVHSEARCLKEIGELLVGIDRVFLLRGYTLQEPRAEP